ncbi:MAG: cell wall hydrolase [Clostridiales bacterium]|nr:cell wall hydrolase [Clostridiales bacterium]
MRILKRKILTVAVTISVVLSFWGSALNAATWRDRYELLWNNATDAERYNMSTEIKAYACGLSTADFIFFTRVVNGEGLDADEDITDMTLVACCVLNRINCRRWPTRTVMATLQRPGQFEVVDRETGECHCGRSKEAEWAIVMAYRLVADGEVDCHMDYYNSIGFTGYSRDMIDYAYFGGNYFSCNPCDCDSCSARMPDWDEDDVEMLTDDFRIMIPTAG